MKIDDTMILKIQKCYAFRLGVTFIVVNSLPIELWVELQDPMKFSVFLLLIFVLVLSWHSSSSDGTHKLVVYVISL